MLQVKVIGIGAAGNKAAIKLIEDKVVQKEDVVLMNSTMRDIPAEYKDMAIMIEGDFQGYAKERNLANQYITENLRNNRISLDTILRPDDKFIIIVTSVEGGTGSGASTVLARYFSEVLEANVHLFSFTGFEDDTTGRKNTVEWFQELTPTYVIQSISNKKFLKEAYNNRIKAQELANQEFSDRIKVLIGNTIRESPDQNIDITDFMKLDLTPGFMTIETRSLDGIKNIEDFNEILIEAIDHSKSLDIEPSPGETRGRIGVILELNERTKNFIDWEFQVLRERYANPMDLFIHVQHNIHKEETISFIVAGMKIPVNTIEKVYEKFVDQMEQAKQDDDFFGKRFDTSAANAFNMNIGKNDPNTLNNKRTQFFGSVPQPQAQPTKEEAIEEQEKQIQSQAPIQQQRPVFGAHHPNGQKPTGFRVKPDLQNKRKPEIIAPVKSREENSTNLQIGLNQTDY